MKKNTKILTPLLIATLTLTACSSSKTTSYNPDSFTKIENNLVYDNQTHIIYYLFNETINKGSYSGLGYGYMSPYYSSNGSLCRYENSQIIEVIK